MIFLFFLNFAYVGTSNFKIHSEDVLQKLNLAVNLLFFLPSSSTDTKELCVSKLTRVLFP